MSVEKPKILWDGPFKRRGLFLCQIMEFGEFSN
jgi:hypothetical protein